MAAERACGRAWEAVGRRFEPGLVGSREIAGVQHLDAGIVADLMIKEEIA